MWIWYQPPFRDVLPLYSLTNWQNSATYCQIPTLIFLYRHVSITYYYRALGKWIVKFIYSQKAIKFCKISNLLLSYVVPVKSKLKISQNVVAFSEYMNFNWLLFLFCATYTRAQNVCLGLPVCNVKCLFQEGKNNRGSVATPTSY